jgi:hypothetical protein
MTAVKSWKSKANKKTGNRHRIVRWECDICEISETIHGNGSLDEAYNRKAIEQAEDALRVGIEPPKHNY